MPERAWTSREINRATLARQVLLERLVRFVAEDAEQVRVVLASDELLEISG